ncbi:hypothetical protein [Eisenbergiella sp.]
MEYITAKAGGRMLYIEKDRVEEILINPEIWRVPGAPEDILGITFQNQALIIYHNYGTQRIASCAILVRNDAGQLYGIAADTVGEEELLAEEEEAVLPAADDGVWEKKSD